VAERVAASARAAWGSESEGRPEQAAVFAILFHASETAGLAAQTSTLP